MTTSALYVGSVVHQRVRPVRHRLSYRVFSLLLDLDEVEDLGRRLRLFGYNRFAVYAFRDDDHGAGNGRPLRAWIESCLATAGIKISGGAVRILCYPRILGYVFNPLTVYYCYERDGRLAALLYEVNNTFGDRHTYVIPVATDGQTVRQTCDKALYVSPFNDVSGGYRFALSPPDDRISLVVNQVDDDGLILHAAFSGVRRPLTDRALARAFFAYPLMTVKVIVGIHLEAFRLWRKGLPLVRRPKPPEQPVTVAGVHPPRAAGA